MNRYKNLEIWKRSMKQAVDIYKVTEDYPIEEKYGLVSQMRRSSIAVSSNIAEGAGRRSNKDFKRYLDIAYGSLYELETQILISERLDYIDKKRSDELCDETTQIQKMIYSFSTKLDSQDSRLKTHD